MIELFFGTGLRDVDCAFKIYNKRVFKKIKLTCNTGMAVAESIIKSKRAGFKIKELGVNHYSRLGEVGKFDNKIGLIKFKVVINLLKDMRKVWIQVNK